VRSRDPAAARSRRAAGWAKEPPAERAGLLGVLSERLEPADEPFLGRCLRDRRGDVRALAARLLTRLPGSALAGRAATRARAAVRVERSLLRTRVVVTVPAGWDAAMAADQVPAPPAQLVRGSGPAAPVGPVPGPTAGPGGWLLLHVVAAAPLATWVPGLAGRPADLVRLEVADGWRGVLWLGWAQAALREGDRGWAAALLQHLPPGVWRGPGVRGGPADGPRAVAALLELLPGAERAGFVAELLLATSRATSRTTSRSEQVPAALLLRSVPGPWPGELAIAVLDWFADRGALDEPDARAALELAARRLPIELTGAVRQFAEQWPPASVARRLARAAADLMTTRHDLLEELQ
jgi:hypothetical protein